jgi:RimJ/RimL family protein N-acetyltransferase
MRRYFPESTLTLEQTREELEWFLDGHPKNPELGLWATIEKSTEAFLGRCGLLPWTLDGAQEIELAFLIDKRRWGEGFATEAAMGIIEHAKGRLGLKRLICLIMPGNLASMRVARKVGMEFERKHRDELGECEIWARSLS